jgi:hypothetical protein
VSSVPGRDLVVEVTPLQGVDAERAREWVADTTERCLPFIVAGLAELSWGTIGSGIGDFTAGRGFSADWEAVARFVHDELPVGSFLVQEDLLARPDDRGVGTSFDGDRSMVAIGQHVVTAMRVTTNPSTLVPMLRGASSWQCPAVVALPASTTTETLPAILAGDQPSPVVLGLVSVYDGESLLIGRPTRG